LRAKGLTYDLGGIGTSVSQWQVASTMTPANVSMQASTAGDRDIVEYGIDQVPVPIIHKDFKIDLRSLDASRRMGSNIDLTNIDEAATQVAYGIEDLILKGRRIANGQIYGVLTNPKRIVGTSPTNWKADPESIYDVVLTMIDDADRANRFGPFNLYLPSGLANMLYKRYADGSGDTVMKALGDINLIENIRVSDRLPKNRVVLMQMTSDTIDLAIGQDVITVEWETLGGMETNYKVLASLAPRIKPDIEGNLGIVDYTIPGIGA